MLTGCAETQLASTAAKRLQKQDGSDDGTYKVGNPYRIDGRWYFPRADYSYRETGIASWYGTKFHNRRTANGEIFDMRGLSAAHRTLPLPSLVRVTNLENGRSLVLRVNDRGPFARGRIIDVSRRGARLLGFYAKGTARVRVEILPEESRQLASLAQSDGATAVGVPQMPALPQVPVDTTKLPGSFEPREPARATSRWTRLVRPTPAAFAAESDEGVSRPTGVVTVMPVKPTRLFVQAGAFSQPENADRLKRRLDPIAPVSVQPASIGGNRFFRVRLGPLNGVEDADVMLRRLIATGHREAKIVVE